MPLKKLRWLLVLAFGCLLYLPTLEALQLFREWAGLEPAEALDEQTRSRLNALHDSGDGKVPGSGE